MGVKANPQLTITTAALRLDAATDADNPVVRTVNMYINNALHIGGAITVTNGAANDPLRGALFPAGFYSFDLDNSDQLYGIAPSGTSVVVESFEQGV